MEKRKRLGDILVERGLITEESLQQTLKTKSSKMMLGDTLVQNGTITEHQLIAILEQQMGTPSVDLYEYSIDKSLTELIPKDSAKRNRLIPIKREGRKLFIAMADPMDLFAIEEIQLSTGYRVEPYIATKEDINQAINQCYEMDSSMEELLDQLPKGDDFENETLTDQNSPVVRLVNEILASAVEQRASDIHIDPHENEVLIRYRVDGYLKTERTLPKNTQNVLIARIKIISALNITENRVPQDGRIKMNFHSNPLDLRVSTLPTIFGEKVVLRLLDLQNAVNDLSQLGLTEDHYRKMVQLIEKPNGIVLLTGPTGSGKTSTLYASLTHLNTEDVNIVTIEDPVEYQLDGINQLQVNSNVNLTFATGLRSILRQDPNIIMVGEIRDFETAEIAIRASLTGHLVLSTVHTNDSISTINRLIDMGVEPFLVASSVSGIVAQRLVRRVCRDCTEVREPTNREKEIFANRGIHVDQMKYGKGCGTCNMTGYKGRFAIHEIFMVDESVRTMMMNRATQSEIQAYVEKSDMKFLLDDGLQKVKEGLTTTEEILRVVSAD